MKGSSRCVFIPHEGKNTEPIYRSLDTRRRRRGIPAGITPPPLSGLWETGTRFCISTVTSDDDAWCMNRSVFPLSSLPEFRKEENESTDEYHPHDDD
jgi:hypothetical protein